ncbi:fun14 domain-containing protein 2 [Lasius niger]|uniref:Protein tyrosine phosphatase type IVA 3 n=1 Tax=Lasius niger TaxID=67767 RepID=A0A0J7KNA1_LASNI|nr:fun14 domain-containing protein 2 [Lasius niger]
MSTPAVKKSKEDANKEAYSIDASKEARSILEKFLGDVSKSSATKQIIIGSTSGWVTGLVTMKIGKVAACAVGGGIIMLQIAAHQGYIKINWDKITKKAEKITDKVEEKITGEGPKFMDKVVDEWFELLKNRFRESPDACVAVHCVAGLGRAPVLVAIALIELGLKFEDAVALIREKRRGAINAKQLTFLEKYRPKSRLKLKNGQKNSCCIQ